ncbi:maker173 [Drosophila busckii]|uniref:carboxylesterase n=1 Tax=Drosophila busckii TaxID=30019 RepID=A0A0M3QXE2_DROBS|nr:esterase-5B [Drosophila busckii]ALC45773.1 maker173 [Drosophila busckii]
MIGACLCFVLVAAVSANPLLVQTRYGQLQGVDNGNYYSYESIPYAEPPLGELRFEPPQPYKQQWQQTFNATQAPVPCLQWSLFVREDNKLLGEEDCLFVNIYKPKRVERQSFPVVVLIHGGAFMFGGAVYNGHERIMESGNVMLVKVSYRLGPLGFLSAGDSNLPGNLGLKDVRLAIKWIKQNIGSFAGEPENIVLLGHSAGAAAAHFLTFDESAKDLMKSVISIGGSALHKWALRPINMTQVFALGHYVGCEVTNCTKKLKSCLQSKDAKDIVSAVRHFLVFGYVPIIPFGPTIEPSEVAERAISTFPEKLIKDGKVAPIPWTVSYTSHEGVFYSAMLLQKQADGSELIEVLNTQWNELAPYLLFYDNIWLSEKQRYEMSAQLKAQYMADRSFNIANYAYVERIFTDAIYRNGTQAAMQLYRQHVKSPHYAYVYDTPADNGLAQWLAQRTDIKFGAAHGDDMFMIFESPLRAPLRADEQQITKHFIKMIEDAAQTDGIMAYSNCVFQNNAGQSQLQLMAIRSNGCENLQVDALL